MAMLGPPVTSDVDFLPADLASSRSAAGGRAGPNVVGVPDAMRCCKPGCGAPTAARLTYDHAAAKAWVDDPGGEGGWSLCASHADRLRLPTGWTMVDQRQGGASQSLLAS